MRGVDFASWVNEEVRGTVALIRARPEQGKNVEAATMRLGGLAVDFVALRPPSLGGHEEGRIGSPEEDARHRDLTVNALFYQPSRDEVEDWTGGVADLRDHLLRTPLLPSLTLKDDPLRVLRAIRFAAVLGWSLSPALVEAGGSPEVRLALQTSIARERIGAELAKMLLAPHATMGLQLLLHLHLIPALLTPLPPSLLPDTLWSRSALLLGRWLELAPSFLPSLSGAPSFLPCAPLAALLLPYASLLVPALKGRSQPLSLFLSLEALKLTKKEADYLQRALDSRPLVPLPPLPLASRSPLIRLVRAAQDAWPLAVLLALLEWEGDQEGLLTHAREVVGAVVASRLSRAWECRPLLSGPEVMAALHLPPGPRLGRLLEALLTWQLEHDVDRADLGQVWLREHGHEVD